MARNLIIGDIHGRYLDPTKKTVIREWYGSFPFLHTRSGANAEVDYVIQEKDRIIPVEVKSNTSGKMQSMAEYLKTHDAPYGIRVSLENFGIYAFRNKQIHVIPVYGVSSIKTE